MKEELKTPYEWCLEGELRVLDLPESKERIYFEVHSDKPTFMEFISQFTVKPNSMPRKTANYLELRMYGLVPYNLSDIQKGIQYQHGVTEYGRIAGDTGNEETYNRWADKWRTSIVLSGGTTNENKDSQWYGTMQQHRDALLEMDIPFATFHEPDLNDTMTAVIFLVDERVFNRILYPDFKMTDKPWADKRNYTPTDKDIEKWEVVNEKNYAAWEEKIGGSKNAFLRNFLPQFRLA